MILALLGCYAAWLSGWLLTFRAINQSDLEGSSSFFLYCMIVGKIPRNAKTPNTTRRKSERV